MQKHQLVHPTKRDLIPKHTKQKNMFLCHVWTVVQHPRCTEDINVIVNEIFAFAQYVLS